MHNLANCAMICRITEKLKKGTSSRKTSTQELARGRRFSMFENNESIKSQGINNINNDSRQSIKQSSARSTGIRKIQMEMLDATDKFH